jgi:hypothetical protein
MNPDMDCVIRRFLSVTATDALGARDRIRQRGSLKNIAGPLARRPSHLLHTASVVALLIGAGLLSPMDSQAQAYWVFPGQSAYALPQAAITSVRRPAPSHAPAVTTRRAILRATELVPTPPADHSLPLARDSGQASLVWIHRTHRAIYVGGRRADGMPFV